MMAPAAAAHANLCPDPLCKGLMACCAAVVATLLAPHVISLADWRDFGTAHTIIVLK